MTFTDSSVRDAEPLRYVLRTLQLVEHRDGVILKRDEALSLVIDKELVVGRAILPCALARRDLRGGTEISPVQSPGIVAPNAERLASLARFLTVDLRKVRQIGERLARRDLQTARSADVEHALHFGIA